MPQPVTPYAGHPFAPPRRLVSIEPGDTLARVWNHEDGASHGYEGTDWNPTIKALNDHSAGRFDPLTSAPQGFIYGAQSSETELVAILETFRSLMGRHASPTGQNVMSRADRDARSLCRFEVLEPIQLIDINTQAGRECFRMDEEVVYAHDRPATRSWSQALYEQTDAHGIAFNSTRESLAQNRKSFILWKDRAPNKNFRVIENVFLGSSAGRAVVDAALLDFEPFWV